MNEIWTNQTVCCNAAYWKNYKNWVINNKCHYGLMNTKYKLRKHYHFYRRKLWAGGTRSRNTSERDLQRQLTKKVSTLSYCQPNTDSTQAGQYVDSQQTRPDDPLKSRLNCQQEFHWLQSVSASTPQYSRNIFYGQKQLSRCCESNSIRKPVRDDYESTSDCSFTVGKIANMLRYLIESAGLNAFGYSRCTLVSLVKWISRTVLLSGVYRPELLSKLILIKTLYK